MSQLGARPGAGTEARSAPRVIAIPGQARPRRQETDAWSRGRGHREPGAGPCRHSDTLDAGPSLTRLKAPGVCPLIESTAHTPHFKSGLAPTAGGPSCRAQTPATWLPQACELQVQMAFSLVPPAETEKECLAFGEVPDGDAMTRAEAGRADSRRGHRG